jgi:hypothetical protein
MSDHRKDYPIDKLTEDLEKYQIPGYMHGSIINYVRNGWPVGDFLRAIIEGDFYKAAAHADEENFAVIGNYARFFFNCTPAGCFGQKGVVKEWNEHKGLHYTVLPKAEKSTLSTR